MKNKLGHGQRDQVSLPDLPGNCTLNEHRNDMRATVIHKAMLLKASIRQAKGGKLLLCHQSLC